MSRDAEIFANALEVAEAERHALLDHACAGDPTLRQRVEALLAGHNDAEDFFAAPLAPRCAFMGEEKSGDVIGRYTLRKRIGEGGCGVVWLAEQSDPLRRSVALKVIKLGMDTKEVIARFEAERQALALMDHPNIARVFDGGATDAGRPYFVMELVRGLPITRYCDEHELKPLQRIELFIAVCHAIQHAHQKGIIHRDIKPSNILVAEAPATTPGTQALAGTRPSTVDGPTPRREGTASPGSGSREAPLPKVIDFGIAKATQGRLTDRTLFTAFHQMIGTPAYMSPEQAEMNSVDVDTRSDIYSLGVLLYELLTGHTPFDRMTFSTGGIDEIRARIRTAEPQRPSSRYRMLAAPSQTTVARLRRTAPAQLSSMLRGDLDWIVMRCLEKERTRRYETANGLAMDLRRYLRHEPVLARPPSVAYRFEKLVTRHGLGFAAGTFVLLALVAGLTLSTVSFVREKAERERATAAEQVQNELRRRAERQELAARRHAYASDMHLLQRALDAEHFRRAQELLNAQRPQSGQKDLRGWEWRYLWQFCQTDPTTVLVQKPDMITSLAVSSDESWLAATEDTKLWVINLRTRQEFELAPRVSRMAFSPREPVLAIAETVASPAGEIHRLRLWNTASQQTMREWPLFERCIGLGFSADGRTLVGTGMGESNHISVWRVADGTVLARHLAPTNTEMAYNILGISNDASAAAYAVKDGRVRWIDLVTGRERWISPVERGEIQALAFSPDQRILATGAATNRRTDPVTRLIDSVESRINLWDTTTGTHLGGLEGHQGYVRAVVFSPDGRLLVSAGRDKTIRVWDVASRRLLKTLRGHQSSVTGLALLSDNATLISSSLDGTTRRWDLATLLAAEPPPSVGVLPGPFIRWRFVPEGQGVVTLEAGGDVVRWHGRGFAQRDARLAVGRIAVPRSMGALRPDYAPVPVAAEFAADVPLLAASSRDGVIEVWDWSRRTLVREILTHTAAAIPVGFIGRGGRLLVACGPAADGPVELREWDLGTGGETRSWPIDGTLGCAVSPTGSHSLIVNRAGTSALIDLTTGAEEISSQLIQRGWPVAFSPDARVIVSPNDRGIDESPWIWDARTLAPRVKLSGFLYGVISGTFAPDGARIATGGAGSGEAISLWNAESYELLLSLEAPGILFQSIAFSPDGDSIGAMTAAGTLHLWRAPSWREIGTVEKAAQAN